MNDLEWMSRAIELAQTAQEDQEVPVGALLVKSGKILAEGYNQPISKSDPTAHAEIQVLRKAAENLGNYRLLDTTLYVTLEPCVMCLGAIIHARIKRLVFGAYDPKAGAVVSVFQLLGSKYFNHPLEWTGGVRANDCSIILSRFFQEKRGNSRLNSANEADRKV